MHDLKVRSLLPRGVWVQISAKAKRLIQEITGGRLPIFELMTAFYLFTGGQLWNKLNEAKSIMPNSLR